MFDNTETGFLPDPPREAARGSRSDDRTDTELVAVITAAVEAFCEERPSVSIVGIRGVPETALDATLRGEETPAPADSFVVRTIKRRG